MGGAKCEFKRPALILPPLKCGAARAVKYAAADMHAAAAHPHSAAATAHTHAAAAAKMSAATPATEVSTATSATEVTAAATAAAKMSTTAPATAAPETAASGVSNSRQTKGKAYCGRACRDFPHGMPSLSGPNAETNARSPGPFRRSEARDAAMHTSP